MAALNQQFSKIRPPLGGEKIFKDEGMYSFDTPESDDGLYICMQRYLGFGKKYVNKYFQKTGNATFLHLKRIKKELPKQEDDPPAKKPTRLAIGVEGGFDVDEKKFEIEEKATIVILPEWTEVSVTDPSLPQEVQNAASALIAADSAAKQEELAALAGTWDGEKRVVSKHATNLLQLEKKKIPPSGWKCDQCDKTDNLWLNLTDGSILCGRKFWDGTGGNNHAVEHYERVKYPLAVKLGTITPDGAGLLFLYHTDVFSYDEDDMVLDPQLADHLAHWGIDVMQMQKTDKTMTELEIEGNQKLGEWDVIQEAGSQLQPAYGPGLTGMRNLGNSCYMNSVMQVLFSVPDFEKRFYEPAQQVFDNAPADASQDFNVQMCKLGVGLLSGNYSKCPPPAPDTEDKQPQVVYTEGIRPQMFKTLVGKGHPEFATKRQQDSQEFLLHILNMVERNSRGRDNPCDAMKFQSEERIECMQSHKVKYTHREDLILALPIPLEDATNKEEVETYETKKKQYEAEKKFVDYKEVVRPSIPLASCLEAYARPELVEGFYSSAVDATTTAKKSAKLSSFPDFLFIQLKKFTISDDWTPKKLDVAVQMPDEVDLSALRGTGIQAGEEELPEAAAQSVNIDEAIVSQLVDMGFDVNGSRKAVYNTQSSGIEPAMNWVMEHMGDPDFSVPLQLGGSSQKKADFTPNEEAIMMINSMGFTREQAIKALKATDNNIERAADWIFSHAAELDQDMDVDQAAGDNQPQHNYRDGSDKYKLVAFISHMGTSTMVGHYVCHILKNGRWIIFNDEKVAFSENPPKDLGYIYLYQRV